jgi:hypothetical protein
MMKLDRQVIYYLYIIPTHHKDKVEFYARNFMDLINKNIIVQPNDFILRRPYIVKKMYLYLNMW